MLTKISETRRKVILWIAAALLAALLAGAPLTAAPAYADCTGSGSSSVCGG